MDFSFTDEQLLMVDSIRECLLRVIPESKIAESYETGEFPLDAWKAFCDEGFTALGMPEELGGVEAEVTTQILAAYAVAKYGGPLSGFYTLGLTAMRDLKEFGTSEQQKMILEPYINGGPPFALGMSEPGTGSDVSSISTSYVHEGDNVKINGRKHYSSLASQVNYILLLAKDATIANPYKAVTMFLLPANTPGVRITNMPKMGGTNPCHICEIFLDDVILPKSAILGVEHQGFKQSMANFETERTCAMAASLAYAENAFEDACTYANQRVQFGKPIAEYQLIQEMVFEMKLKVELIRNLLFRVAWEIDQGMDVRVSHALLKYYGARAAQEVVDDAIQVLGGVGCVGNHRVIRYYCDCRASRIGAGSDQVMIFSTAPRILEQYK